MSSAREQVVTGARPENPDPARMAVMNFLNEVAIDYPSAVSLASGRPAEGFFEPQRWLQQIDRFVDHFAEHEGLDRSVAFNRIAQYGRTNGLINALVARQLQRDEGIDVEPEWLITTAGCQEAMALAVCTLCRSRGDVLLVRNPTYIGVTGIADLYGIELAPVGGGDDSAFAVDLETEITRLARAGKRPRALYLIPEFDNPTGAVLSREVRECVVALCATHQIVILEDNPYGMFRFEGRAPPPLRALDRNGCVIYLGTYSKTLCPALRVGYMALPAQLFGNAEQASRLRELLSQAKSFLTVNTSQLMQALVGGVLLAENCSLARMVQPALAFYRRNRDAMLGALELHFDASGDDIRWNRPAGGFFLTVDLPFAFGRDETLQCAREQQVLVMPLRFFALNDAHDHRVRLAFSNGDPGSIAEGVGRFACFVRQRLEKS